MTAEYELTKDDLIAFNLYHHLHFSRALRRQYYRAWFSPAAVLLLICTGVWYLAAQQSGTPLRTFLDLLPLFSGVPFALVASPWLYRRTIRKLVARMAGEGKNRGLFSRRRITISKEGITDVGEFAQSSTAWWSVERVLRNKDHVFVYTSTFVAIIVPRRAFTAPAEFEDFARTASDYHKEGLA